MNRYVFDVSVLLPRTAKADERELTRTVQVTAPDDNTAYNLAMREAVFETQNADHHLRRGHVTWVYPPKILQD